MPVKIGDTVSFDEIFSNRNGILLNSGDIHVWSVALDAKKDFFEKCLMSLSEQERKRIPFFKFEKVQNSYIISQGTLRLFLSSYLNQAPQTIHIGRHNKGKPFPTDFPELRFNMSNSGNKVVYVFSGDEEVGIDLEKLRDMPDLEELIAKNFSFNEQNYINKTQDNRQQRFFKFWTIKEAYLKAIGEGMRLPPHNLEFSVENGLYKLRSVNGVFEQEDWLFTDIPEKDYVGTLVYKNPDAKISLRRLI